MKQGSDKPLNPDHLSREGHRLVRYIFHTYKDYIFFFGGIFLGMLLVAFMVKGFFELLDSLRDDELGRFDDHITLWALSFKSDGLTRFMQALTHFGDRFVYIMLCLILGIYIYIRKGNLVFALQTLLVLAIAGGLSFWLKDLIGRPRPEAVHELGIRTYSFPSGHAMSSIAFYGFLIHLSWRMYNNRLKKILITVFLLTFILLIGFSRIYLQVHYPSDVLSGFAAGGACLLIFIIAFSAIRFYHRKRGEDTQPDNAVSEDPPEEQDAA